MKRAVHVEHGGDPDGSPAVFLHAMLGRARSWRPVWEGFVGRALSAPDLPGHGRTDYDPTLDVQDQAVADALAVIGNRRVDLVGHSFGATVALRVALEAPERVRSLVLIEPVYFVLLADARRAAYEEYLAAAAPLAEAFERDDLRQAAMVFLGFWSGDTRFHMPMEKVDALANLMPLVRASEASILRPGTPGRVKLADVATLRPRALLVEGSASPPVVKAISQVIRAASPNVQGVTLPNAGHMMTRTHPNDVSDRLNQFWSEVSSPD